MTDAERDHLLQALAMAVRDLQARHDKMADAIHNVNQRLSIQEAATVIEEITQGEVDQCAKH